MSPDSGFVSHVKVPDLAVWRRMGQKRALESFELEITARCNNNCRHCYINLPAGDRVAMKQELTIQEIGDIADQAIALGAAWCNLTGGEPLLRPDFADLYLMLKRKGLLLAIFTNACLVTREHAELLRKYPPRDIEVTVYGVTEATYERVSRKPGSYAAFRRGLGALLDNGVRVRLKAMAMRSNAHELAAIAQFCRERTKDYFRFDPLLHLRYDRDPERNEEIQAERLSPEEIVMVEQADDERATALCNARDDLIFKDFALNEQGHLFACGAGNGSFTVTYDGRFRVCSALGHPDCEYDLRKGKLAEAWSQLAPRVRSMRSDSAEFASSCRDCPVINLCLWCPARGYLETGRMDGHSEYFCRVAHARAEAIERKAESRRQKTKGKTQK